MLKKEIQLRYPEVYKQWRGDRPKDLRLDSGVYPIRDLWERADGVWQQILVEAAEDKTSRQLGGRRTLVAAHNGINQAMLCRAAGLDENYFRKMEFPNCGVAEVIWNPGEPRARRWRWLYPAKSVWVEIPEVGLGGGPPPAPVLQSEVDAADAPGGAEEQGL
jgi:broad specificity phosphatase PhoE